jgi:hypothetical protein
MQDTEIAPIARTVPGFFEQLADCCGENLFTGIDLAGRQLKEGTAQRIAVLTLEKQPPIALLGNDHDGTGMNDVFTHTFVAVRQRYPVKAHVKQLALENLRAVELCFVEMRVIIFHQTIPVTKTPRLAGRFLKTCFAQSDRTSE